MNRHSLTTAYKIVVKSNGGYASLLYTPHQVFYQKIGVNTPKIKNSYLFVFDTLNHAKEYVSGRYWRYEIWRVSAANLRSPKLSQIAAGSSNIIRSFYQRKNQKKSTKPFHMNPINIPTGTRICDNLSYVSTVVCST